MNCFNVILHYPEYRIQRSGLLVTNYSNRTFNSTQYTVLGYGSVDLCMTYKPSFLECPKWKLDFGEYYINADRSLVYKPTEKIYPFRTYSLKNNASYVCIPEELKPVYLLEWIFISAWCLSILALLIALYLNVPCKRLSRHKYDFRPLYCHMISFLATYIFLILFQLTYSKFGTFWEIFIEYGAAYTDCTTFSWLSVVGYDTWRAFHPTRLKANLTCSSKEFWCRSFYAWGLPFILVTLAIMLERLPVSQIKFGMSLQGLQAKITNNVLIFGTQIFTLFVQFVFCTVTLYNIRTGLKNVAYTHTIKQKRKTFKIFIKLVFVMSVTCILALSGYFAYFLSKSPLTYFLPTGIALQGVFLFLIHGLRPLKKKVVKCCGKN